MPLQNHHPNLQVLRVHLHRYGEALNARESGTQGPKEVMSTIKEVTKKPKTKDEVNTEKSRRSGSKSGGECATALGVNY